LELTEMNADASFVGSDGTTPDPFTEEPKPQSARVTALRQLHGLTQGQLAERVGVSQSFLSYVERGQRPFPVELARRLTDQFDVPDAFFYVVPTRTVISPITFRKTSRASVRDEERIVALYNEACRLFQWASLNSGFPSARLPDPTEHHQDPEILAHEIRRAVGLDGEDAVSNAVSLLESLGVGVIDGLDRQELDTQSAHSGVSRPSHLIDRPIVALVTPAAPSAVKRLTLLHELGHLVLDRDLAAPITSTRSPIEHRAFVFGAAVLLPLNMMRRRVSDGLSLRDYLALKADYGVSVGGIVRRAKELGLISESRYRSLSIQLSSLGWRNSEPVELPPERPRLLLKALLGTHPSNALEHASHVLGIGQQDIQRWTSPAVAESEGQS
jgi:Zn-dependent peptidase ImmA (M78 family)/transcriptional regulator with XRE-family HTH domain